MKNSLRKSLESLDTTTTNQNITRGGIFGFLPWKGSGPQDSSAAGVALISCLLRKHRRQIRRRNRPILSSDRDGDPAQTHRKPPSADLIPQAILSKSLPRAPFPEKPQSPVNPNADCSFLTPRLNFHNAGHGRSSAERITSGLSGSDFGFHRTPTRTLHTTTSMMFRNLNSAIITF